MVKEQSGENNNLNQRSGLQTKILKIEGKNQTQSRFKVLLEEDSETATYKLFPGGGALKYIGVHMREPKKQSNL